MDIHSKINKLKKILQTLQPGIIAISGGLDSAVLAKFITVHNLDFTGIFFRGNHMTHYEQKWAREIFKNINIDYSEFEINLLELKEVKENHKKRCYFCKKYLFSQIKERTQSRTIIEGSHVDDYKEYRPGIEALKELKVISPYNLVGMSKKEIYSLGSELGLPVDRFPVRPCLLTRFPYNTKIDPKILNCLNRAESYILGLELQNFRIRIINGEYNLHVLTREKDLFLRKQNQIINELKRFNVNIKRISFVKKLSGFFDKKIKKQGEILWLVKYFSGT
ncbi:ATP-dependent sacrificial sulfur transferase LarE [Desulfothermus naphthae]